MQWYLHGFARCQVEEWMPPVMAPTNISMAHAVKERRASAMLYNVTLWTA